MDLKKMLTEKNVGKKDKHMRLSIGALMFAGGVYSSMTLLGVIGLLLFITGLRENCGIYAVCGLNTREDQK